MTLKRLTVLAVAFVVAVGLFPVVNTQVGSQTVASIQSFLVFYVGVGALLAFTGAVVWGLLATERFVPPRYRLLAQGIHRGLGLLGLGFLGTHIVLQVLSENATVIDAVVPFLDTKDRLVATGLGTIASDLMVVVYVVGRMRARFVDASRPWLWRVVHGIAYFSWPLAIMHGLTAGRPVAGSWVTSSYIGCLIAVVVAVLIRLVGPTAPGMRAARRSFDDIADAPPRAEREPSRQRANGRPRPAERPANGRPRGDGPVPRPRPAPPPERERRRPPREPVPPPRESTPSRDPGPPREPVPPPRKSTPSRDPGPPREPGTRRVPSPSREYTRPPDYDPSRTYPPPRTTPPDYTPPREYTRPLTPTGSYDRTPPPSVPQPANGTTPAGETRSRENLMWTTGPMPAVPDYTAPQAAVRDTTGPQPRVRDTTGPQPRVGTGPQPAVRDTTGGQPRVREPADDQIDLGDERPRLLDRLLRRDWLDSDDGPRFGRRRDGAKPAVSPDLEEIEFWANLRAETSVWIRRGRR